jgi:leucyl aminopeptidase
VRDTCGELRKQYHPPYLGLGMVGGMNAVLVSSKGRGAKSVPVDLVTTDGFADWKKTQSAEVRAWLGAVDPSKKAGTVELIPGPKGTVASVLAVVDELESPWSLAALPSKVPAGTYHVRTALPAAAATTACAGWILGGYKFRRYKTASKSAKAKGAGSTRALVVPSGVDLARAELLAASIAEARDLINTPAEDLGPSELAAHARKVAKRNGAKITVLRGAELLRKNYPMIHAVGRASDDAPHFIDMRWGKRGAPKVTLVGKGVCFDSGGLDIKPSSGMLMMKKDMGGAAAALSAANLIMGMKLPVSLRVLVPAVENSISGNAFRPLDVIRTRKGITVEIGNTDAEGRLVLCEALTEACSEKPDVIVDFATLTGAARVALGTDLPALFANDDTLADDILAAGKRVRDPLWRMPLHRAYRKSLDSTVADINNAGQSSYGGAITAALFLEEFVDKGIAWAHIDTMAWNLESRAGRPTGGEALAVRAVVDMLEARYRKPGRPARKVSRKK